MTLDEWNEHPEYAAELYKVLNSPIFKTAAEIVSGMTMANAMDGQRLLRVAANGQTLFGYDVGRGSIFKDFDMLANPPQPGPAMETGYAPPKHESKDEIVKIFPKKNKRKPK